MKKIVCTFVIAMTLFTTLTFGMVNTPQNSTPMSTQEMQSIVGGGNDTSCACSGKMGCCTFDAWIFSITICTYAYGLCE
jgi:hypothetical protein